MDVRRKISAAQKATLEIDECLIPSANRLLRAVQESNGAAIYPDPSRVRSAMADMEAAIKRAREIYIQTAWPTDVDYDTV